ncbi:BON domain-containing protein [uncultured Azohydromonas sp.]|jgi:gas vesicle protein|uniref:BON domain-containing protein n=1 Tax=uncultured Azohydromonas sp. TaxID=487342 RepID=UPI0026112B4C|nr:BON domain-containing protein [uncultured Azohydromonas sp.]
MKRTLTVLGMLTAGAAALYLGDPQHGRRRRAALQRQVAEAAQEAAEAMEGAGSQALDRLQELGHESRQSGRQAADRLQAWADEGRHAGRRTWYRAKALAREGRDRLSARHGAEALEPGRSGMGRPLLAALGGIAIGAAAMLLLDPQQRSRRWAQVRDQALRLGRSGAGLVGVDPGDLGERARGLASRAAGLLQRNPPDDTVLVQRVRAALERSLSHPDAIRVTADSGCVSLGGAVLAEELARLFECVASVRGVRRVQEAGLAVHASADEVPALQGGASRSADAVSLQVYDSPGPRLAALAGGAALVLYGASRRGLPGLVAATAGLGLALRAARNEGLREQTARLVPRMNSLVQRVRPSRESEPTELPPVGLPVQGGGASLH